MPQLPQWLRHDNFSPRAHQRLVDGINRLQIVQPISGNVQVSQNPQGTGIFFPNGGSSLSPGYFVALVQNGGTNGTASSIPAWTYDVYDWTVNRASPTGQILEMVAPIAGRGADASYGAVNAALWGLLVNSSTGPQLAIAFEYPQVVACTSP